MIVYKDKGFLTNSDYPNSNWTDEKDVYIVEDNSDLANNILKVYPNFDFVLNDKGDLIDIEVLEVPEPPEPQKTLEDRIKQMEDKAEKQEQDKLALMDIIAQMSIQVAVLKQQNK